MTYYTYTRAEIRPFLPADYNNILEIGCGEGKFRMHFDKAHTYWGIEPFTAASEKAAGTLDRVLNKPFDEALDDLPDDHFDLIICNDVIEHLPETGEFLQQLRPKMAAGAHIVGSVPNIRHFRQLFELLVKRDWRYREAGILDNTHLRFYTMKSFERTLTENAFDVEAMAGINGPESANPLKKLLLLAVVTLLGRDTRHPQMAFRARKLGS